MLDVIAPGLLMTAQDLGRPGARRYGVPAGGAIDAFALAAANLLVGNSPGAAGLEITAGGAELAITGHGLVALAGADLGASLDGRPLPLWTTLAAAPGQRLRFSGRAGGWGGRVYLAVAGGLDLPVMLGSRATDLGGGFGGLGGRPLRRGDRLNALPVPPSFAALLGQHWPADKRPPYGPGPTLRLLPGPHLDCLAPAALDFLTGAALRLGPLSNRMGYRLDGLLIQHARPCSLPSLGVVPGVIQVPPDGTPILLMADAQTTGGYPVAATLISADLPLAAQLLPGDALRLVVVSLDVALRAREQMAAALAAGPEPGDGEFLAALAGALPT